MTASDNDRLATRGFALVLLAQLGGGCTTSVFLLLPKFLTVDLGASGFQIGVLTAVSGVAVLAALPFLGRIIDRFGGRGCAVAGNLLMAITALVLARVTSFGPLLLITRAVQGFAAFFAYNACMMLATELAPATRLAQAIGLLGSANLVTNAIAPPIVEPLADRFGFHAVFAGATGLALLSALVASRLPRVSRSLKTAAATSLRSLLSTQRHRHMVFLMVVSSLAFWVMFTLHQPFALSVGIPAVRTFFVGYTIAALGVRLGAGRMIDRLGYARIATVALFAYGAIVAATSQLGPGRLGVFGFLFGIAQGALVPAMLALSVSGSDPSARRQILTLMNGASNTGCVFVPLLGALADHVGYPTTFMITGIATAFTASVIPRREKSPPPLPGAT